MKVNKKSRTNKERKKEGVNCQDESIRYQIQPWHATGAERIEEDKLRWKYSVYLTNLKKRMH